ncbi:head GIN domain-containing protein [Fulvivirga lutimaris]|uniref:head GIN domain-containing protein n=1 Tax=Fulvivirga lutimaris TaxID=1819566 RepID=UPI0012BBB33B|nr:head GIN domain-containing protein [Fulvivirga lutimaris]MTI40551.1 DUF2807 domain-containing protein [Fulvivirga lutimaris]
MKKILILSTFIFSALVAFAQDSEIRDVSSFDGISLGSSGTLFLTIGSEQKVELKGKSSVIEDIITEVRGSTLIIKQRNSSGWFSWSSSEDFDVYVTVPSIEALDVSGSGRIYGKSKIASSRLDLGVSGSGRMEIDVDASMIEASVSGSGRITVDGKGKDLEIHISGSGSVDAEHLAVENVEARISGSGRCEVNVSKSIDARISGSGSVYYKGDPDKVNSNTSGSGRVKKIS